MTLTQTLPRSSAARGGSLESTRQYAGGFTLTSLGLATDTAQDLHDATPTTAAPSPKSERSSVGFGMSLGNKGGPATADMDFRTPSHDSDRDGRDSVAVAIEDGTLLHPSGLIFALKVQIATNIVNYEGFLSEIDHLEAFVGDDRVLQLKDFYEHRVTSRVFILLELGVKDLQSFCKQAAYRLDSATICRLWRGLVDAVSALHKKQVIHFDLKPHNFLLCVAPRNMSRNASAVGKTNPSAHSSSEAAAGAEEELSGLLELGHHPDTIYLTVKVGDFGLARTLEEQATHLSMVGNANLGTVCYMAPEALHQPSADGKKRFSPKVDVWSICRGGNGVCRSDSTPHYTVHLQTQLVPHHVRCCESRVRVCSNA